MQTRNRLFDDLAKVAGGAASTFSGIKDEIEAVVRARIEKLMGEFDLVNREEFEAARAMAAKARSEQEKLEKRVAALEAKAKKSAKSKAKPKAKPKAKR